MPRMRLSTGEVQVSSAILGSSFLAAKPRSGLPAFLLVVAYVLDRRMACSWEGLVIPVLVFSMFQFSMVGC